MNPSVSPWFSLLFLSLVCALPQSGCSRTSSQQFPLEKTKPLPEVASRDQNFSKYEPPSPFSQTAPGLFTRTVYQSDGPLGYRVEVRDLSVAAKKRVENISLHGAAFVEVLYGTGAFTAAEKRQELKAGSTVSISEGQSFTLDVTSDLPLTMRVRLITAR